MYEAGIKNISVSCECDKLDSLEHSHKGQQEECSGAKQ